VLSDELGKARNGPDGVAGELDRGSGQSKPLDIDAGVEATPQAAWTLAAELDKATRLGFATCSAEWSSRSTAISSR
jgi:hypothetical protein